MVEWPASRVRWLFFIWYRLAWCYLSKVMFHHWLVYSSEELKLGWRENSNLSKWACSCLKVELDFLVLLLSRYFEVPYSLCSFFGGGVRRRVWEFFWIVACWWLQGAWRQEPWGEFCNCLPDPGCISQRFCFLLWNCRQIMFCLKGNPPILLVGMQTGAASLGNSVGVPQKVRRWTTIWSSNCCPRYLPKGYKNADSKGVHAPWCL